MIIAIDGPSASGKGTLGKRIAEHYGLNYLDTGLLYRQVAHDVLNAGADPGDEKAAATAARDLKPETIDEAGLRTQAIADAAAKVAVFPSVREAILKFQQGFARTPPGAVLDGRDIGTVVCPDADVKLFVTDGNETRARRRYLELTGKGATVSEADVLADLEARDRRDESRTHEPEAEVVREHQAEIGASQPQQHDHVAQR